MSRPCVVLMLCILIVGCGPASGQPDDVSPVAAEYLNTALDIMQQNSIKRDTIDWERFRSHAFVVADGAETPADTHGAIRFMVSRLGDNHSRFMRPEQAKQLNGASQSSDAPLPRHELIEQRIGYLELPYLVGDGQHATVYMLTAHQYIRELHKHEPCGWIVDLQGNYGGNMWTMLVSVGPILGEGDAGAFVDPDGNAQSWGYRDGQALIGDEVLASIHGRPYPVIKPLPPVAVLMNERTASSGEAIAVAFRGRPATRSFGRPTAGLSTGNETYHLSDGAVLVLTEVTFADRTGTMYGAAIEPDQQPWFASSTHASAVEWLLRQPSCTDQ